MGLNMNMADVNVMRELVCGSNVLTEQEYRDIVLAISEYACRIVTKTLGPYGKTTNIDDSTFISPTKDGWTVLRNLRFSDPLYNSIYNAINQISFDLVTKVGDGTTSALTGANIFLHAILAEIEDPDSPLYGMRQADLLDRIEAIKEMIVTHLRNSSDIHMIDMEGDFSDIYKVAYIASNGNEELSQIIKDIYAKTKNPNIYVTLDPGDQLTYKIQKGFKYDCNIINQKVYRNSDDGTYKLDEPLLVAIFDHNITYNEHHKIIESLSRYANARHQSVMIVAPYFDDIITNILNTTINSYVQRNQLPNIIMMQVPMASSADRTTMSDFVLLTNAQVFDYGKVRAINVTIHNSNPANIDNKIEDALLDIEQYHFETVEDCIDTCIGKINKATIGDKYVVIENYESVYNKDLYEQTIKEIENEFIEISRRTNKSSNVLTKDYMYAHQRYIKMLGQMGTIYVGAQTELEKHCLKDSVDDAVLACRSAANNGYIRGLNLTTLSTIDAMGKDTDMDFNTIDFHILGLFNTVFSEMSYAVIKNKYPAGETAHIMTKTIGEDTAQCEEFTPEAIIANCIGNRYAYNLVSDTFETDWTVINSLATDVEILNSIVGVLAILLTSDQFVSLNKQFDRSINRQIQLEHKKEEAKALEMGRLEARKEFYEKLIMEDDAYIIASASALSYIFGK